MSSVPASLRSRRVAGVHRYYGGLRLPAASALLRTVQACSRARDSLRRLLAIHRYRLRLVKLDTAFHSGGWRRRLATVLRLRHYCLPVS